MFNLVNFFVPNFWSLKIIDQSLYEHVSLKTLTNDLPQNKINSSVVRMHRTFKILCISHLSLSIIHLKSNWLLSETTYIEMCFVVLKFNHHNISKVIDGWLHIMSFCFQYRSIFPKLTHLLSVHFLRLSWVEQKKKIKNVNKAFSAFVKSANG